MARALYVGRKATKKALPFAGSWNRQGKERDCRLQLIGHPSGFVRLQPPSLVKPQIVNQAFLAQCMMLFSRHRRSTILGCYRSEGRAQRPPVVDRDPPKSEIEAPTATYASFMQDQLNPDPP